MEGEPVKHGAFSALPALGTEDSAHQGNAMVMIKAAEALGSADGERGSRLTSLLPPGLSLPASPWKQIFGF